MDTLRMWQEQCDDLGIEIKQLRNQLKDAEAVIGLLLEYIEGGYEYSPAEQWCKVANALKYYVGLYCWDKVVGGAREKEPE